MDLRQENTFIECGFALFNQQVEPNRERAKLTPNGMAPYYLEHLYFGRWDREGFKISDDEDFILLEFEPEFRLYYAIAGLNGICAGWNGGECAYFGEYLREFALGDADATMNSTVAIGIKVILNSLLLIDRNKFNKSQSQLMEVICDDYITHGESPYSDELKFKFDKSICQIELQ